MLAGEEMNAERREVAQSFVALSGGDVQVRMNQAGRVLYRGRGSARVPREWCEGGGGTPIVATPSGERNLEAAPARRGGGRRQCGERARSRRRRTDPGSEHRDRHPHPGWRNRESTRPSSERTPRPHLTARHPGRGSRSHRKGYLTRQDRRAERAPSARAAHELPIIDPRSVIEKRDRRNRRPSPLGGLGSSSSLPPPDA